MNRNFIQYATASLILATGTGLSVSAIAADIDPSRFDNPPVSTPIDDWQGFYTGVSLGVVGGGSEINKGAGNGRLELGQGGLGLGAHLGYNFGSVLRGANGAWMFGSEADISSASLKTTKNDAVLGNVRLRGSFVGTARLRGGYAWEKLYLYGTAGLAISDFSVQPAGSSKNEIRAGAVIGLGAEFKLRDRWTMRAEALSFGFGEEEYVFSGSKRKVDLGMATLRLGISRKF